MAGQAPVAAMKPLNRVGILVGYNIYVMDTDGKNRQTHARSGIKYLSNLVSQTGHKSLLCQTAITVLISM